MPWHAKVQTPTKKNWYEKWGGLSRPSRPASDGPTAGTDLPSLERSASNQSKLVRASRGGTNFSGGVHIFQKNSFQGGTNLKGVQIKRDRTIILITYGGGGGGGQDHY